MDLWVSLVVESLLDQPDDDREVPSLIVGRQDDGILVLGGTHCDRSEFQKSVKISRAKAIQTRARKKAVGSEWQTACCFGEDAARANSPD